MRKLIIGISGVAGAGKDTFADILEKELDSFALSHDRYSLAEPLKKDVRGLIIEKFGIDILSCTREEKDLVRPLIVGFAEVTRKMSKGIEQKVFQTTQRSRSPERRQGSRERGLRPVMAKL